MKVMGWLLAACVAIALLKLAVTVLVVAFAIALLIGLWIRPTQTVGFILLSVLLGWAAR